MIGEAASPGHPAHPWILRHYEGAMPRLERAVRAGQEQGAIHPDAPAGQIARTTIALMDGLQVHFLLDPELDMAADLRVHVEELKRRWSLPGA